MKKIKRAGFHTGNKSKGSLDLLLLKHKEVLTIKQLVEVVVLIIIAAAVNGIVPVEENQDHSYSSCYDAEDEHNGKEIFYDLPLVKSIKNEGGIPRQVDDIANKEFQTVDNGNDPWAAYMNLGLMKSEPYAYPYVGIIKESAEFGNDREGLTNDNRFGFPVRGGLAFDAGLAKNYELEREAELAKKSLALQEEIERFANEGFAYYPTMELVEEDEIVRGLINVPGYGTELSEESSADGETAAVEDSEKFPNNPTKAEGLVKEDVIDKSLDSVLENGVKEPSKKGSNTFSFNDIVAAEETIVEKEKAAWSKALKDEESAKLGLLYYPLLAFKNIPFEFKEAELKRDTFEKMVEPFPAPPKFVVTSHSYT